MLRSLGAGVEIDGDTGHRRPRHHRPSSRIPVSYTGLNRVPILWSAPCCTASARPSSPSSAATASAPARSTSTSHALRQFGAEVELTDEGLEAKALRLHGAHFALPFPSVGATETVLLTAAVAEGRTILENAAVEPEVVELALFLQRMGARIELQPDRRFVIEGVSHLAGATQRLGGDRIEAFSYLVAGLATGGQGAHLGLRPGPAGDGHLHPPAHGRPVRDHRRPHHRRGRPAPAGGGADQPPPGVHDRLAAAPRRALHPGRTGCR